MHVEHVGDQIRNYGRARAALWQRILMTCNLRYYRRHIWIQRETGVSNKVPAHTAEVDRRKEVFQVDIEDVATVSVSPGVGDNRSFSFEAVRNPVVSVFCLVNFIEAILKQIRQPLLGKFQSVARRLYCPCPALPFWDFKGLVFGRRWLLEQNVRQCGSLEP